MDTIDWGTESDAAIEAAYSSTLMIRDEVGQHRGPQGSQSGIRHPTTTWDDLTTGAQWIVLKILCEDGLSETGKRRGFASIITTVLQLSHAQIQSFLITYISQYEAWVKWENQTAAISWDKLLQLAANANRSIFDLLPKGRPNLSTDRISKEEVDKAAEFLRSRQLDRFSEGLQDWIGLNVYGDFLGLCVEKELLQDCLDGRLLRRAHGLGLVDLNVVERQYRDICDEGKIQSRVPAEVFASIRGGVAHPSEEVPRPAPAAQAKRGRKQHAATDKKASRAGQQTQNNNGNKQKKNAGTPNTDETCPGGPRERNGSQDCREADEVRAALGRQFFCHAQPFLPGRFVSTLVEQCQPPTCTFKVANHHTGRKPPSKDVITVSHPASANEPPDSSSSESSERDIKQPQKQTLGPSAFKRPSAGSGNGGNKNTNSSQGRHPTLTDGYKSLKAGVVQAHPHPSSGLSQERVSGVHQTLAPAMPVRQMSPTVARPRPENPCGNRGAQVPVEASAHTGFDRTALFNRVAAPDASYSAQASAASQLREALDTRYANYLTSPVATVPPRRERKPSRRVRDNCLVDAAAAPDSDGDDDYVPESDKASKPTCLRPEGNRRATRPPFSAAATVVSTSSGLSDEDQTVEDDNQPFLPVQPHQKKLSGRVTSPATSRKLQPIFGHYRNRVLTTQRGRLETTAYAWSACQAEFADTATKARFALTADRPIAPGRHGVVNSLDKTIVQIILEKQERFRVAERAAQGEVGQDAEHAVYAGCANHATYAVNAEEAEFAAEFLCDATLADHSGGSDEGEAMEMEGVEQTDHAALES